MQPEIDRLSNELRRALEISKKYEDRYFWCRAIALEIIACGDPKPWKVDEWNAAKHLLLPGDPTV